MKIRTFTLALLMILAGCGAPKYVVKGPLAVPIEVQGTDGKGVIHIRKLSPQCEVEATFDNAIGKNPRLIYVDLEDHFSFQLAYYSPFLAGCNVKNTFTLKYGDYYRIHLISPPPGSPKDQTCTVQLETSPNGFLGSWKPTKFEGTCAKNERL